MAVSWTQVYHTRMVFTDIIPALWFARSGSRSDPMVRESIHSDRANREFARTGIER